MDLNHLNLLTITDIYNKMPLIRRRMRLPIGRVRRFRGRRRSYRKKGMKRMEFNYHDSRTRVVESTDINLASVTSDTSVAYDASINNTPKWILWQEDSENNSTSLMPVTAISQGTSTNTRIGKRILVKKVMFDLNITAAATNAGAPSVVNPVIPDTMEIHFALVRHRASSGALPINQHIYEYSGTSSVGRPTIFRQKNYTNQYDVLKSWYKTMKFDVEWNGTTRFLEQVKNIKKTISVNKYCIYKSDISTGTPTAHQDGGLYLLVWANLDTAEVFLRVNGMSRLTFIDV